MQLNKSGVDCDSIIDWCLYSVFILRLKWIAYCPDFWRFRSYLIDHVNEIVVEIQCRSYFVSCAEEMRSNQPLTELPLPQ